MTSQPNENWDGKHLKIPTQETSQALDNEGTPKCLFCPLSMSFKISHDCYILRFNPITQMIPIYMSPKSTKQSFFLGARNHFDILKLSFYHQCFILSSSCLGWKCTFCVYRKHMCVEMEIALSMPSLFKEVTVALETSVCEEQNQCTLWVDARVHSACKKLSAFSFFLNCLNFLFCGA